MRSEKNGIATIMYRRFRVLISQIDENRDSISVAIPNFKLSLKIMECPNAES